MDAPRPTALPRVLIVDDESGVRSLLARTLARAGFAVDEAADAGEALARLAAATPAVAILDLALPDRDGLSLLADLKRIDPGIAVIVITGAGDEETALRAGAASYYRKPFHAADLVQEARRLAAWRASPPTGPAPAGHRSRSFTTAQARDLSLVGDLTLPLRGLLHEDELLGVRIGIGEMIANAVEHGNLGITASEKEEALVEGRFAALLAERLATPANAAKQVHVETRLGDGEFRVMVRDEGAGFAWRALSAEPGATLAGRGVLLARVHFDEVHWNERGNEVTLVKRLV
jgi:DNA-binding response OmpR family regulator